MKSDDTTTVGAVLLAMGLITPGQLAAIVEEQNKSSVDELIGALMVKNRMISSEQLEMALSAQSGLRSKKKHTRAMAVGEIAKQSNGRVIALASTIREKSSAARRKVTGSEFKAITSEQLVKKSKFD